MLPVTFQFIIAMVAYAINEQLARRIEYLLQEVRVLREVYTESSRPETHPVYRRATSPAGDQGQGVDARGTRGLLPDCPPLHHPFVVSTARCPEVR